MQQTLAEQTWIFVWALVLGAVLGGVYIVLTVIRILTPPSDRQLLVTDILFVTAGALANFLFALSQTCGRIRGYVIAAEIVSFLVLYFTIGRLLRRSAFGLHKLFLRLWRRLTKPVRQGQRKLLSFLAKNWRKLREKSKKT